MAGSFSDPESHHGTVYKVTNWTCAGDTEGFSQDHTDHEHEHTRSFISSLAPAEAQRLGRAVREHWSVENNNHHKRDHHVWQEDRHRHRRVNIAQNLALTRNALLAIVPFDENHNLPALIVDYQDRKQLAIDHILKAKPFP